MRGGHDFCSVYDVKGLSSETKVKKHELSRVEDWLLRRED